MAFNALKKGSLGLKEMQIKTPLLYPFWLLGISNIRNSPKRLLMRTWGNKLSFIAGGRMDGHSPPRRGFDTNDTLYHPAPSRHSHLAKQCTHVVTHGSTVGGATGWGKPQPSFSRN